MGEGGRKKDIAWEVDGGLVRSDEEIFWDASLLAGLASNMRDVLMTALRSGPDAFEKETIRRLLENGLEDATARMFLLLWTCHQERLVETAQDPIKALIQLNLRRARLYFAAGLLDASLENFEDVRRLAYHAGLDDLVREIEVEWDKCFPDWSSKLQKTM